MASQSHDQKPLITKEELKAKFSISHFDHNAILRGAQLTVVGGKQTAAAAADI